MTIKMPQLPNEVRTDNILVAMCPDGHIHVFLLASDDQPFAEIIMMPQMARDVCDCITGTLLDSASDQTTSPPQPTKH